MTNFSDRDATGPGIRVAMENVRQSALGSMMDVQAEVERVYVAWLTAEHRSAKALSEVTGVPVARVRRYVREGGFQERYAQDAEAFRASALPYMRTRASEVIDEIVERLTSIVTTGGDSDATAAARVLTRMIGEEAEHPVVQNYTDNRVLSIAQGGLEDMESVKRLLSASIEGNIHQVEEVRSARPHQNRKRQ